MADNAFLQPLGFYKREINPLTNYVGQMATALSTVQRIPFAEAESFIKDALRTKAFPLVRDPLVDYFGKDPNGDRTIEQLPLTQYLRDVVVSDQILVPTFTAYASVKECESPLSIFVSVNVQQRGAAKKEAQRAENAGEMELAFSKEVEQKNKKENNNSLSGLFAALASVFANVTGHNTLTSITRSMASIGNALNERMIGGNRHYRNKEIAINNLIAIIHTMDHASVDESIQKFNLHIPSVSDVMQIIGKSAKYYIFDQRDISEIQTFVEHLTPQQRVAVAYNQDFYHLRIFNDGLVRGMLDGFSHVDMGFQCEDPVARIKASNELVINYAHQACIDLVKGMGKDHSKMPIETAQALAYTCENIDSMVDYYRPLIKAFFLTKTVPCSTAYIQDMVREEVVLSDTDSTMFSVDEWVLWYFGKLNFKQKGFGVAGAVMFITTQCIAHCLAVLSANMGVAEDRLFTLSMKPEFVFPVFVQSPVAKHYFTAMLVKEGAVYKDIKMEIKGVHNVNSANPVSIMGPAKLRMEEFIRTIMNENDISLLEQIVDVADLERKIVTSLRNGETEYLKRNNIKEASGYSQDAKLSPYAHYTLWEDVFAPKYGHLEPPPYSVVKIPTTIKSPSTYKKWLEAMKDQDLARRLIIWSGEHNDRIMKSYLLSKDHVDSHSIPEEIIEIIDYRRIVLDLTNVRRMMLDSLGFPVRSDYLLTELGY